MRRPLVLLAFLATVGVLLTSCTLRGDGIPTPVFRDAGDGAPAPAADMDAASLAEQVRAVMPVIDPDAPAAAAPASPPDLAGVVVFPTQPAELAGELWGAAPFGVEGHLSPGWRDSNRAVYGTDTISAGTVRRRGGALEVLAGGAFRWEPYVRQNHIGAVRMAYRYGPGWWASGRLDPHDFGQEEYRRLSAKDSASWPPRISVGDGPPRFPGDAPITDVSYDRSLYCRVQAEIGRPCGASSASSSVTAAPDRLDVDATAASAGSASLSLTVSTSRRWRPVVERVGLPIPPGVVPPPLVDIVVTPATVVTGSAAVNILVTWPAGLPVGVYDRSGIVISTGSGPENKLRVPILLTVRAAAPPPPAPDLEPTPEPVPPPVCPPAPACRCEAETSRAPGAVAGSVTLCIPVLEPPR